MSSGRNRRAGSIGLRLTAWYLGVFLASTLLLVAAASLSIRSSIRARIGETVTDSLEAHRQAFETAGLRGLEESVERPHAGAAPLYVRVTDRSEVTVFEYQSEPFDTHVMPTGRLAPGVTRVRGQGDTRWTIGTTALKGGLRLDLALGEQQTQALVAHFRSGLLVVWLGAIVLGLLGGFFLTRRALRPIASLTSTAEKIIASGDMALRVPVLGRYDELERLTLLFNGVLERNQALVRGMREALDNVAHDLRTPLTRLRTGAEVALHGVAEPDRLREALADSIEESDRVMAMLSMLMDISEAETGIMKLDRETVDLVALTREVLDLYEHVAAERGVRIVTHFSSGVSANGDRNRLHQVIANLVDNAIKYTPTGGQIDLTVLREEGWACWSIADTGMGISDADLPRIWERLYRADQSRAERGLGLGLSLVKAIVEAHGGSVTVKSELAAGTTFTMKLPTAVHA